MPATHFSHGRDGAGAAAGGAACGAGLGGGTGFGAAGAGCFGRSGVGTGTGGGDGDPLKASETILHNLRVLATDQRTDAIGADGKPEVRTYSNVTLEVTPRMAEKMAVAQTVGQLSLSLRSIADTTADLDVAIAGGNVNLPNSNDPTAEKTALARIAAAPTDRGATLSTGADVSRFQRRTVPPKPPATAVPLPAGPIVRVARGSTVEIVPVGGK